MKGLATGKWRSAQSNAGTALYGPDGREHCWEWDATEETVNQIVAALNAQQTPPWTSEPPTEPGWYWWRERPGEKPRVLLVGRSLSVMWFAASAEPAPIGGQFAGPLAPPPG